MSRKLDRRTSSRSRAVFGALLLLAGAPRAMAETVADFIDIRSFKTHGRVSLRVDPSVEVERIDAVRESSKGFRILLKGLQLSDLGAPFGAEVQWAREVEAAAIRDPRLARLSLSEREDGVIVQGTWKFASGAAAPAVPRMESFHYRRNDDARYVVDFWPKPGPTVSEARAAGERSARVAALAEARRRMQGRRDRRIASEKQRAGHDDNLRFCREAWDEKREVFLPFHPVVDRFEFSQVLPLRAADRDHEYLAPAGDSEEARLFRLALSLHRSGKDALVLKTLDFLDSRVADPAIRSEADFLRANALEALGDREKAVARFKLVLARDRNSASARAAAGHLAAQALEAKDSLAALENFEWLLRYHSRSPDSWISHLGSAEALSWMKQTQRASSEFQWVVENAPQAAQKARAAIRLGDILLERREYDRALAGYVAAAEKFPDEVVKFPSYHLNRAEALYWLGQRDRSRQVFEDFLAAHPAAPDGWRATYRLAELAGRAGQFEQAERMLTETVNRHPYGTGANLSRMRLLSCGVGLERETAVSSVENFFGRELERFDPSAEVFTDRLADYRGLANIRALLAAGDEEKAITLAIARMDSFSKGSSVEEESTRGAVSRLMGHLFRKVVLKKLGHPPTDSGRLAALGYYQEVAPKIPAASGSADPDYLLELSRAAVDLGMPQWGQQLAQSYQSAMASGRRIAAVNEDEIDQRIAVSQRSFTEARALWAAREPDAKISPLLDRISEESPYSFERELIRSLLDDRGGRPASALQHAIQARLLAPASEKDQPRLLHWIARLQKDSKNTRAAVISFRELRHAKQEDSDRLAALGVPPVPQGTSVLLTEVELLSELGRWGEAAAAIAESKVGESGTLDSPLSYRYAQVLRRTGTPENLKKSHELLEGLARGAPEQFWKKMAQEALEPVQPSAKEGSP